MRPLRRLAAGAAAATILASTLPATERQEIGAASAEVVTLEYRLRFSAYFPGGNEDGIGAMRPLSTPGPDGHLRHHRILVDKEHGLYYGYDVTVTAYPAPPVPHGVGSFGVAVTALSTDAERYFLTDGWPLICEGCPAPRSIGVAQRYPETQFVMDGTVIRLDLMRDERTGEVFSDEIAVMANRQIDTKTQFPPVDMKPEDVLLNMAMPVLYVNGEPVRGFGPPGSSVQHMMVWTDLPGHGRIFFSLGPREGCPLTRVGVVAGDRITFTIDGDKYEWVSQTAVATPFRSFFDQSQTWNAWGYHDRSWKPFHDQYGIGAVATCPVPEEARTTKGPR